MRRSVTTTLATPRNPSRAQVLTKVSGVFRHSRMIGIMGPSGCGKTTLMNTLCGRALYGTRRGAVLINNEPLDLPKLKTVMGFVPQDDTVFGDLTVRENISYRYENICGAGFRLHS
jgi:ABC-type multidrug transport system ATPase subunit